MGFGLVLVLVGLWLIQAGSGLIGGVVLIVGAILILPESIPDEPSDERPHARHPKGK